ncbi:serine-rich adhesin for platelets-like isoform X3 [Littorina saxatilis]|uniref:serine-rich adhesin for platelets-like isoform X3 n=1 Tax=Littorina saxatilis TaxID=31220 RepID=UPI0038B6166B
MEEVGLRVNGVKKEKEQRLRMMQIELGRARLLARTGDILPQPVNIIPASDPDPDLDLSVDNNYHLGRGGDFDLDLSNDNNLGRGDSDHVTYNGRGEDYSSLDHTGRGLSINSNAETGHDLNRNLEVSLGRSSGPGAPSNSRPEELSVDIHSNLQDHGHVVPAPQPFSDHPPPNSPSYDESPGGFGSNVDEELIAVLQKPFTLQDFQEGLGSNPRCPSPLSPICEESMSLTSVASEEGEMEWKDSGYGVSTGINSLSSVTSPTSVTSPDSEESGLAWREDGVETVSPAADDSSDVFGKTPEKKASRADVGTELNSFDDEGCRASNQSLSPLRTNPQDSRASGEELHSLSFPQSHQQQVQQQNRENDNGSAEENDAASDPSPLLDPSGQSTCNNDPNRPPSPVEVGHSTTSPARTQSSPGRYRDMLLLESNSVTSSEIGSECKFSRHDENTPRVDNQYERADNPNVTSKQPTRCDNTAHERTSRQISGSDAGREVGDFAQGRQSCQNSEKKTGVLLLDLEERKPVSNHSDDADHGSRASVASSSEFLSCEENLSELNTPVIDIEFASDCHKLLTDSTNPSSLDNRDLLSSKRLTRGESDESSVDTKAGVFEAYASHVIQGLMDRPSYLSVEPSSSFDDGDSLSSFEKNEAGCSSPDFFGGEKGHSARTPRDEGGATDIKSSFFRGNETNSAIKDDAAGVTYEEVCDGFSSKPDPETELDEIFRDIDSKMNVSRGVNRPSEVQTVYASNVRSASDPSSEGMEAPASETQTQHTATEMSSAPEVISDTSPTRTGQNSPHHVSSHTEEERGQGIPAQDSSHESISMTTHPLDSLNPFLPVSPQLNTGVSPTLTTKSDHNDDDDSSELHSDDSHPCDNKDIRYQMDTLHSVISPSQQQGDHRPEQQQDSEIKQFQRHTALNTDDTVAHLRDRSVSKSELRGSRTDLTKDEPTADKLIPSSDHFTIVECKPSSTEENVTVSSECKLLRTREQISILDSKPSGYLTEEEEDEEESDRDEKQPERHTEEQPSDEDSHEQAREELGVDSKAEQEYKEIVRENDVDDNDNARNNDNQDDEVCNLSAVSHRSECRALYLNEERDAVPVVVVGDRHYHDIDDDVDNTITADFTMLPPSPTLTLTSPLASTTLTTTSTTSTTTLTPITTTTTRDLSSTVEKTNSYTAKSDLVEEPSDSLSVPDKARSQSDTVEKPNTSLPVSDHSSPAATKTITAEKNATSSPDALAKDAYTSVIAEDTVRSSETYSRSHSSKKVLTTSRPREGQNSISHLLNKWHAMEVEAAAKSSSPSSPPPRQQSRYSQFHSSRRLSQSTPNLDSASSAPGGGHTSNATLDERPEQEQNYQSAAKKILSLETKPLIYGSTGDLPSPRQQERDKHSKHSTSSKDNAYKMSSVEDLNITIVTSDDGASVTSSVTSQLSPVTSPRRDRSLSNMEAKETVAGLPSVHSLIARFSNRDNDHQTTATKFESSRKRWSSTPRLQGPTTTPTSVSTSVKLSSLSHTSLAATTKQRDPDLSPSSSPHQWVSSSPLVSSSPERRRRTVSSQPPPQEEELRQDGVSQFKTKEDRTYNANPRPWQGNVDRGRPWIECKVKKFIPIKTRHDGQPAAQYTDAGFGGAGQGYGLENGNIATNQTQKEDFHFQEMSSVKNQFEKGPQQASYQRQQPIDIKQEAMATEGGVYESQPTSSQPQWEEEPEEGVYENAPQQRSDVVRESDRDIGAELPSVGAARNIRDKFLTGQVENRSSTVKREITPPAGAVDGGVFENQPQYNPDVVHHGEETQNEILPEQGTTRNMAARFKEMEKQGSVPVPSGKRAITPDRSGKVEFVSEPRGHIEKYEPQVQAGIFESQPSHREDVVRSDQLPEEVLPEIGAAKNIAQRFKQMSTDNASSTPRGKREITPDNSGRVEFVSEPTGYVEKYQGRADSGVFESQPSDRDDVVKADLYQEEVLPERGMARNIAARFKEMENTTKSPPSPTKYKEITPPRENGTSARTAGVFESQPQVSSDVVHSGEHVEEVLPERGMAKNIANRFRQLSSSDSAPKSPRAKKEFTPPPGGAGVYENNPKQFIPDYNRPAESGILESKPEVRNDVVRGDEGPQTEQELPERGYTRNLLSAWKQRESESAKISPTGSGKVKEFTPPREEPRVAQQRPAPRTPKSPLAGGSDGSVHPTDLPGQYQPQVQYGGWCHNGGQWAEPTVFESEPDRRDDVMREDDTDWNAGMPKSDTTKKMLAKFQHIQAEAATKGSPARPTPTARKVGRSKSMRVAVQLEKCGACQKTVYAMEKIEIEKHAYHKSCFRCSHCHCILTPKTFAINRSVLFCTNHYKQLFATKGNYDEGFGHDQHKKAWKSEPSLADEKQPNNGTEETQQ